MNKIVMTSETQHRAGKNAAATADSLVCIKAGIARSGPGDTERGYAAASGKEAARFHAGPDGLAQAKRRIAAVGIGKECPVGASRCRIVSGDQNRLRIRGAHEFQNSSADQVAGLPGQ